MKRNVGTTDSRMRIIIGLVMAGLGIYFQTWWGLLSIIPLFTGITHSCPLYQIIGVNTCD